jgi:hypothetical protein
MGLSKRKHKYQKEVLLGDLSKEAQRLLFNTEDPIKDLCSFENTELNEVPWTYWMLTESPNSEEYFLEAKTETIVLEEREIETPITRQAAENFSNELLQALTVEYKKEITFQILSYLFTTKKPNPEFSIYKSEKKTGLINFFKSLFEKKQQPETYSDVLRKVVMKIIKASNKVASNGRRGPANAIICNGALASLLQDSAAFVYNTSHAQILNVVGIFPVGSLAGMTIYVDPYMKWNDRKMVVGRFTKDEYGLKLFYKPSETSCKFLTEGVQSHRASLKSKDYLAIPEQFENQFEVCEFHVDII